MDSARVSVTDSPWFWAYLFGAGALVAIALAGPKFVERQAQIEREFQGRQRAAQNLAGQEPTVPMSTAGQTLITLRPLLLGMAALTMVAWVCFWRYGLRSAAAATPGNAGSPAEHSQRA